MESVTAWFLSLVSLGMS